MGIFNEFFSCVFQRTWHWHIYACTWKQCVALSWWISVQFSAVTQWCLTLCDPMDCSTPGLPVHHQLPEFTQTHVHPTISSSVVSFSSHLWSFQASASFPMSQFFASGGQHIGVFPKASILGLALPGPWHSPLVLYAHSVLMQALSLSFQGLGDWVGS